MRVVRLLLHLAVLYYLQQETLFMAWRFLLRQIQWQKVHFISIEYIVKARNQAIQPEFDILQAREKLRVGGELNEMALLCFLEW